MSDFVITVKKNGSYHVRGKVTLVTPEGHEIAIDGEETWLCRCGHSSKKPFCDGTHKKIGFQSDLDAEIAAAAVATAPAMAGYEDVCAESEVAEGEIKGVMVGGLPVVIGRVDGQLFAIGGRCTHQDALLEDGELDEGIVRCPLHDSGFDIKTGQPVMPPAREAVPTYTVITEGGRVLVALP